MYFNYVKPLRPISSGGGGGGGNELLKSCTIYFYGCGIPRYARAQQTHTRARWWPNVSRTSRGERASPLLLICVHCSWHTPGCSVLAASGESKTYTRAFTSRRAYIMIVPEHRVDNFPKIRSALARAHVIILYYVDASSRDFIVIFSANVYECAARHTCVLYYDDVRVYRIVFIRFRLLTLYDTIKRWRYYASTCTPPPPRCIRKIERPDVKTYET